MRWIVMLDTALVGHRTPAAGEVVRTYRQDAFRLVKAGKARMADAPEIAAAEAEATQPSGGRRGANPRRRSAGA